MKIVCICGSDQGMGRCLGCQLVRAKRETEDVKRRLDLSDSVASHVMEMREMLRLALHFWGRGEINAEAYERCRRALRE